MYIPALCRVRRRVTLILSLGQTGHEASPTPLLACSYNSFRELVQYGFPSIFVPIELSYLDNQLARAKVAEDRSLGLCLRFGELNQLEGAVSRILDPDDCKRIRRSCSVHKTANGAVTAAGISAGLLS